MVGGREGSEGRKGGKEGRGAQLCAPTAKQKNCENFIKQSSHQHLINNRRPAIAIHAEASNNVIYQ